MLKVQFRSGASIDRAGEAYGCGRVHTSLMKFMAGRDDIKFVDSAREADLQVCYTLPAQNWQSFHWWGRRRHPRQVIFTFSDASELPLGWKEILLEMKAVFAPSHWGAEIFRRSLGNAVPVHLVHHGVDPEAFPYLERDWNAKPFVYLWQGMHPADRKGFCYVRQAFQELNLPDTWLLAKWYPKCSTPWPPAVHGSERMTTVGMFLKREAYRDMLQKCHVSLNPSRGECFGMMPLETASTGMPSAATNWSGFTDYLNPRWFKTVKRFAPEWLQQRKFYQQLDKKYFWPLKYTLSEPGQDYISTSVNVRNIEMPPTAQDAIVDMDDLKDCMRYFYENRQEAAAMGKRAHEYVKAHWGWSRCADMFVDACKKVMDGAA